LPIYDRIIAVLAGHTVLSLPTNSSSEREHRYTGYADSTGAVLLLLLLLLRGLIDHERNSQHIPREQQEAPAMRGQRTHQLRWTESTTTDKLAPHLHCPASYIIHYCIRVAALYCSALPVCVGGRMRHICVCNWTVFKNS